MSDTMDDDPTDDQIAYLHERAAKRREIWKASDINLEDKLGALGTPEQIQESIERLEAMDSVNMVGKRVAFSIYAVGDAIRVIVHEVVDGSVPLLGGITFSPEQWVELRSAVDPLVDAHARLLAKNSDKVT